MPLGIFKFSAFYEVPDSGERKRYEVGQDDGYGSSFCAVEDIGHGADEGDAGYDHDQFFDEVYDTVGNKLFVPPKSASYNGIN